MRILNLWKPMVVGVVVLSMLVPAIAASATPIALRPGGAGASAPMTPGFKDPTVGTNWAGYGVHAPVHNLFYIQGSWVQPTVSCPTTNFDSEAIGVGLNAFPVGGKIDGVGTIVICVFGTPDEFTWFDEPQTGSPVPAVLTPTPYAPGNIFQGNVSCSGGVCQYLLVDLTTHVSITTTWSYTSLSFNWAECVVMRGTSLGLPAVFHAIPTTPGNPTQLTGPVLYGSHYTGVGGCWIADAAGSLIGLAPPPAFPPGYATYMFEMNNPPPAGTRIDPSALAIGITGLLDSFTVP
jgi:hypothetical protein